MSHFSSIATDLVLSPFELPQRNWLKLRSVLMKVVSMVFGS